MALVSIILYLTVTNFLWGQLFRLQIFSISIPLLDVFIILLSLANLIGHLSNRQLKPHYRYLLYFLVYTFINLCLNLYLRHLNPIKPLFYFLRLSCLLSLFIWPINSKIFDRKFNLFFSLILFSSVILGLIQYLFWPDFRSFSAQNWDPHLYRLVGTFFDPTFTALIYLLFLIRLYLHPPKNRVTCYLLLVLVYTAFSLTYSRAAFLSFLVVSIFLSRFCRQPKIFIKSSLLLALTLIILPRLPGEGTKLERTSSIRAKIENYRQAISLFSQTPIIGYGYNTLEKVRNVKPNSHAASGFDNSILTIFVTTGILGGLLFSLGLRQLWIGSSLAFRPSFIAVFAHSFFSNSLLYPWILLYLALISSSKPNNNFQERNHPTRPLPGRA